MNMSQTHERVEHLLLMLAGSGLKRSCTPTSDTICEPLEGFYCNNSAGYIFKAAQRHSSCKPGQYISQNGRFVFLKYETFRETELIKHLMIIFIAFIKVNKHIKQMHQHLASLCRNFWFEHTG